MESFFDSYIFFILLAAALVPALVLGLCRKRLSYYGFGVSLVFLCFLFSTSKHAWMFLLAFLVVEVFNVEFYLHRKIKGTAGKAHFVIALILALAPLTTYKICEIWSFPLLGFLGISYITFKVLQMVLETHDGLIEKMNVFECLYFLVFFGTFESGPIDRSRRFIDDMRAPAPARAEFLDQFGKGLALIIVGLLYSIVLADLFKGWFNPVAFDGSDPAASWITFGHNAFAYAGYLFFNFAGYSLMAMGTGYCFGIKVPRNFRAPFISTDIKDFWNRWHITLSYWLRDFVFMRFTRFALHRKLFKSRLTTACCAFMINMTLMGCWHGLTPDYLMYGAFHGILLSICEVYQKKSAFHKKHRKQNWYKACSWAVTMVCVLFSFCLFSGQLSTFVGWSS